MHLETNVNQSINRVLLIEIKISTILIGKDILASFCGSVVALSVSDLEVVGSSLRSGCHKISSRGEMQNLVSHNPEICHKFLCKYSGAVYAKNSHQSKGCAPDSTQWAQAAGWCRRTVSMHAQ